MSRKSCGFPSRRWAAPFLGMLIGTVIVGCSVFGPGVGEVIVCAYVDDEPRDTFDGVVPAKLSAEEVAASIKVSNVMDIAAESFGEIPIRKLVVEA